jgi:5-methylcytosine-specific restriction endonuclease McrA
MSQQITARNCLREPIPEIEVAARLLDAAVTAHLEGHAELVERLVRQANMPAIREWTDSLWGANSPYAPSRKSSPSRAPLAVHARESERMPSAEYRRHLHLRDGYHCRFCGIPVIRKEVRQRFRKRYPQLSIWGRRNVDQHAAFQAMWAQYDHVVPHSAGGGNGLDNLVVTCAPCNYSRMDFTLEESGLVDPRIRAPVSSKWDGLERFR